MITNLPSEVLSLIHTRLEVNDRVKFRMSLPKESIKPPASKDHEKKLGVLMKALKAKRLPAISSTIAKFLSKLPSEDPHVNIVVDLYPDAKSLFHPVSPSPVNLQRSVEDVYEQMETCSPEEFEELRKHPRLSDVIILNRLVLHNHRVFEYVGIQGNVGQPKAEHLIADLSAL